MSRARFNVGNAMMSVADVSRWRGQLRPFRPPVIEESTLVWEK
jgi:hypothetical protein